MRNHLIRTLLFAVLAAGFASQGTAETQPPSPFEEGYINFEAVLEQCTGKYGYDPDNPPKLGKYELAPNELEWRSCAYDGIRQHLIPNSKSPGLYQNLIALDKEMTAGIQKGIVTRKQREETIENAIDNIETQEAQVGVAPEVVEQEQRTELTRRAVQSLRGL